MDKVIPILPCPDIKGQVEFYQQLGFDLLGSYKSPNSYAVVQLGDIELHFYGSRKMVPAENATMCFVRVEDVDAVYNAFISGLKQHTGKIPRSGIPRISKVRDLVSDRRFTLTDMGGNTLFVGTPVQAEADVFFRTLQNETVAEQFTILYDLVYSKEDCAMAAKLLPRLLAAQAVLDDLDKAKLLLTALEIQRQLRQEVDDSELRRLLEVYQDGGSDWAKVKQRYLAILQEE
jgi:hypothetical protein